jgi:hypothetical protein
MATVSAPVVFQGAPWGGGLAGGGPAFLQDVMSHLLGGFLRST